MNQQYIVDGFPPIVPNINRAEYRWMWNLRELIYLWEKLASGEKIPLKEHPGGTKSLDSFVKFLSELPKSHIREKTSLELFAIAIKDLDDFWLFNVLADQQLGESPTKEDYSAVANMAKEFLLKRVLVGEHLATAIRFLVALNRQNEHSILEKRMDY